MSSCPLPPGASVIAYARDSGGQGQDRSVAQQLAAVAAYCHDHGLVLVRTFTDEATPGSTTAGRDAFLEMVSWLRQLAPEPGVHGVIDLYPARDVVAGLRRQVAPMGDVVRYAQSKGI